MLEELNKYKTEVILLPKEKLHLLGEPSTLSFDFKNYYKEAGSFAEYQGTPIFIVE